MNVIVEQVYDALDHYLNLYFSKRDYEGTLSLLSEKMHGFGTGKNEIAYDSQAFSELYGKDINSVPDPIGYKITSLHIEPLSETIATASLELNLDIFVSNQNLKLNNLRASLIFQKYDERWLIDYKHISFPAIEHGENESYPNKELEERNVVLERLVEEKTADLKKALHEINILAITDKLTDMSNRSKLDEKLEDELIRTERYGNIFSVIMIDIDYFKDVNDRYGHLAGDQFLKDFSTLVSENIRNVDFPGRWGGEEFLILCPETGRERALTLSKIF